MLCDFGRAPVVGLGYLGARVRAPHPSASHRYARKRRGTGLGEVGGLRVAGFGLYNEAMPAHVSKNFPPQTLRNVVANPINTDYFYGES